MDQPGIIITPSVSGVVGKLGSNKVHAYQLVDKILESHKEYAGGTAREVHGMEWPQFDQEPRLSAEAWIDELKSLFDPVLTPRLHGRVAILGLCLLDKTLGRHLRSFTAELRKELLEDFESLLLPEHAGEERYRRSFLKILQNRAKQLPDSEFPQRQTGFTILSKDGIGLDTLAGLCFKQKWNSCYTARYQVSGNDGFADFLQYLMTDLEGLAANDLASIGSFLPEPRGTQRPQGQSAAGQTRPIGPSQGGWIELAKSMTHDQEPQQQQAAYDLARLVRIGSHKLEVGQRMVFFIEWRGIAAAADAASIGLNEFTISVLKSLPERLGIVISGLPDAIRDKLVGDDAIYQLELPREREPRRGQRLLNDTPIGPDRLNIQDDVEALADAIALKAMSPPLVVGIFGGWGTGKSFVMHLIQQRLRERRCEGIGLGDADRENYTFVGHPYLVTFDAWTYAKGNLWASLMQTILVELDRQISLERSLVDDLGLDPRNASPVWQTLWQLTNRQRNILTKTEPGKAALESVKKFNHDGSPGRLWQELSNLREAELEKLELEKRELEKLFKSRSKERQKLEAAVDDELAGEAQRVAWLPVWEELGSLVRSSVDKDTVKTFDQMIRAIPLLRRFWLGLQNLTLPLIVFMAVAAIGVWFGSEAAGVENLLAKLSGAVAALGVPWMRALKWFEQRRNAYEHRIAVLMESKDKLRQQRIEEQISRADRGTPGHEVAKLDARIADQQAAVDALRARAGITGQARSLSDFLRTRIEEGLYQKELGLLDQVQNDIQELSDTLLPAHAAGVLDRKKTHDLFPRGDPRVVLFIDDLDRCPPGKVVEVLEAAQLLVKTQLFVVVIAIDVRYVTRALESEYREVLVRSGEPSGLDYIEKIIQIPYRVRPVSAKGIELYLSSQMDVVESEQRDAGGDREDAEQETTEIEDSARQQATRARLAESAQAAVAESITLPPQAIEFEPEEYVAIHEACRTIPVSPRTMKRLVNVFKLLKIIWYRQGMESGPMIDVKKIMLSILALCSRYPEVMRKLLSEMDAFYRDDSRDLGDKVAPYLAARSRAGKEVALYPPDWEQVAETIEHHFPQGVSFGLLKEANLHLLISFSFVGETDSEREATLRRGFYKSAKKENEDDDQSEQKPAPGEQPDQV